MADLLNGILDPMLKETLSFLSELGAGERPFLWFLLCEKGPDGKPLLLLSEHKQVEAKLKPLASKPKVKATNPEWVIQLRGSKLRFFAGGVQFDGTRALWLGRGKVTAPNAKKMLKALRSSDARFQSLKVLREPEVLQGTFKPPTVDAANGEAAADEPTGLTDAAWLDHKKAHQAVWSALIKLSGGGDPDFDAVKELKDRAMKARKARKLKQSAELLDQSAAAGESLLAELKALPPGLTPEEIAEKLEALDELAAAARLAKQKGGDPPKPMWFWFCPEDQAGDPVLLIMRKEAELNQAAKAARREAKIKRSFAGYVESADGALVFYGDGPLDPMKVEKSFKRQFPRLLERVGKKSIAPLLQKAAILPIPSGVAGAGHAQDVDQEQPPEAIQRLDSTGQPPLDYGRLSDELTDLESVALSNWNSAIEGVRAKAQPAWERAARAVGSESLAGLLADSLYKLSSDVQDAIRAAHDAPRTAAALVDGARARVNGDRLCRAVDAEAPGPAVEMVDTLLAELQDIERRISQTIS